MPIDRRNYKYPDYDFNRLGPISNYDPRLNKTPIEPRRDRPPFELHIIPDQLGRYVMRPCDRDGNPLIVTAGYIRK